MDMTPNPAVTAKPDPPIDASGKPNPPVMPAEIGMPSAPSMDKENSVRTKTAKARAQVGFAGVQIQDAEDNNTTVVIASSGTDSLSSVDASPSRKLFVKVLNSEIFKAVTVISLMIALFGGSLFIIFAVPDDPGVALQDVVMVLVLVVFMMEIFLKTAVEKREYLTSFFFYMDLLGTFSMLFEISFILGTAGKLDSRDDSVNTLLLRAARASKIGARAGRFTKVVKVFNFIHRQKNQEKIKVHDEARVLNAKLMTTLSSKVAMLTIALVIGVPLINTGRYPVDDLSLRTWARTLEVDYAHIYNGLNATTTVTVDNKFKVTVQAFKDFYNDLWYHPYRLDGFKSQVVIGGIEREIPGENIIRHGAPDRKDFIVKQEVSRCRVSRPGCEGNDKASIYYDFAESKKFDAGMDMAMIVFVVLAMVFECADLSATLNRIVVRPVERMLGTVRMMAKVLQLTQPSMKEQFGLQQEITEDDMEEVARKARNNNVSETELLETVFNKLAKLTAVFMQSSIVDEAEMTSLDYESKGVLLEIMSMEQVYTKVQSVPVDEIDEEDRDLFVPNLQVEESVIQSWQLDLLGMQRDVQHQVISYIFYDSPVGRLTGAVWIDFDKFESFLQAARANYLVNPYHNFIHACDVVAMVFRIMLRYRATDWLTDVDMCALLLAALCHDIGHAGKTNVYLIETGNELAVRYNDKSPLENMHAAKLFELCKEPMMDVFERFNRDAYKQARKVCINTILHTDNALHFDMVKDVKKMYEANAEICDKQSREGPGLNSDYMTEVLQKDTLLWLKLTLHLADISTPLKPFWISRQWATRVQDEFFAQGDEEKRLGLPVGMLNDRQKVNRAGSEHGFINFLVSPLIFAAVGLFPPLIELADQMHINMGEWKTLWLETGPSEDEVKKRTDDIQKVEEKLEELRNRKPPLSVQKSKTVVSTAQR